MPMSVFVSHVYEDRAAIDELRRWAMDGLLGDVVITGESEDARQGGDPGIQRELSPRLRGAGAVLVLVGRDTHDRPWIDYEVSHALTQGVSVIPVRLRGTTGAPPRQLVNRNVITFDPTTIRRALGR